MVARQDIFVYEAAGHVPEGATAPVPAAQSHGSASKRTARACVRCRRQKLKCDSYRPCALCVRANVACVSRPEPDVAKKSGSSGASVPAASAQATSASQQQQQPAQPPQPSSSGAYSLVSIPSSAAAAAAATAAIQSPGASSVPRPVGLPSMATLTESMGISLRHPQPVSDNASDGRPAKIQRLAFHDPLFANPPPDADRPRSLSFSTPSGTSMLRSAVDNSMQHQSHAYNRPVSQQLPPLPPIVAPAAHQPALPSLLHSDNEDSLQSFRYPSTAVAKSVSVQTPASSSASTSQQAPPRRDIFQHHQYDSMPYSLQVSPFSADQQHHDADRSSISPRIDRAHVPDPEIQVLSPWAQHRQSTASILAQLPPRPVVEYTFSVYFSLVHWFMTVLHEGKLLVSYQRLIDAFEADPASVPDTNETFADALLCTIVVAIGGRYAATHPVRRRRILSIYEKYRRSLPQDAPLRKQKEFDIDASLSKLLPIVRSNLVDSLSCCTLSTVQTCLLLAIFYLYHGNSNLAWTISGNANKAAQALLLHQEGKGYTPFPEDEQELRRRTFWAVYAFDKFLAVCYGRPICLLAQDCTTELPMSGKAYPLPGRSSYLMTEDDLNTSDGTTLLAYERLKLQYYMIVGDIMTRLYRQGVGSLESGDPASISANISPEQVDKLIETVHVLESSLRAWYESFPEVLRLQYDGTYVPPAGRFPELGEETGETEDDDIIIPEYDDKHRGEPAVERRRARIRRDVFGVQAVVLQMAYDNAVILIQRPLLAFQSRQRDSPLQDIFTRSAKTCWLAALRTSQISRHSLFGENQQTHAIAFVGMHLFTAGVLLGIYGSSEPLSQRALQSKLALSRILQMRKTLRRKIIVYDQGFKIMENLARIVVQNEMNKILSGDEQGDENGDNFSEADKSNGRGNGNSSGSTKGTSSLDDKSDDDRSAAAVLTSLSYRLAHAKSGSVSPPENAGGYMYGGAVDRRNETDQVAALTTARRSPPFFQDADVGNTNGFEGPDKDRGGAVENRAFKDVLVNIRKSIYERCWLGKCLADALRT
ncbi:fungal-specific transcription factor domain-containing protein [Limtongia smithiae]|uniref:fungal-specific transcription factor domain-containing protein n=1 Tax=Limtongia smithiae TaxID=1125753 RepID=UPI0034CDA32C